MGDEFDNLIKSQFFDLQKKYPGLALVKNVFGEWSAKGELKFSAAYGEAGTINDEYEVEILIPRNFPVDAPVAKELAGRTKGFHTNHDGTLCLGAPLAVKSAFRTTPTLLGFVENSLIHFLYSCSYQNEQEALPFGDLSHGAAGIFEYYSDLFKTDNYVAVLGLLRILADGDYRGHLECPCGSGARIRDCHGDQLRHVDRIQKVDDFMMEYQEVILWLHGKGTKIPLSCSSKTLSKRSLKPGSRKKIVRINEEQVSPDGDELFQ